MLSYLQKLSFVLAHGIQNEKIAVVVIPAHVGSYEINASFHHWIHNRWLVTLPEKVCNFSTS
jgi:hypothetical protein